MHLGEGRIYWGKSKSDIIRCTEIGDDFIVFDQRLIDTQPLFVSQRNV